MKRIPRFATVVGIAALSLSVFFVGCNQQSQGPGLKTEFVSAQKNSFQEVTSHLDAGGDAYLYLSTQRWLEGLSGKVAQWRQMVVSLPDLSDEQRTNAGKAFDVVTALIKDSGIEDVSGLGMSTIAIEKHLYHTKIFIHHYPNHGTGFLWRMFGERPHPLTGLQLLPATTAVAWFSDADVPMVWSEVEKQVGQSDFPQAKALLNKLPENFEHATGLKWLQVLNSLGGEFGVVLTLDDAKKVPVPAPSGEQLDVPEPGLMIVAKVKDDTIFKRVDEALQKSGRQVVSVDKPDLKMRTVAVPLPVPIQLRPTIASSGGYLFVASSDAIIQDALAVKSGKQPGLKSTDEFKRLAKSMPDQGNEFSFVSLRFSQTMLKVQREMMRMNPAAQRLPQQWLQTLLRPDRARCSYSVSADTDQGWLTVCNTGTQAPAPQQQASRK